MSEETLFELRRARRAALRACEAARRRRDWITYRDALKRLQALSDALCDALMD